MFCGELDLRQPLVWPLGWLQPMKGETVERIHVSVQRTAPGRFAATNSAGAKIEIGGDGSVFTPVELLLAALGACSSVDPDAVLSRHLEPRSFTAEVSADYVREDEHFLQNLLIRLAVDLDDSPQATRIARTVERALAYAHGKTCTVARTLERPTRVQAQSEVSFTSCEESAES